MRRVGIFYVGTTERKRSGFEMVEWKERVKSDIKVIKV